MHAWIYGQWAWDRRTVDNDFPRWDAEEGGIDYCKKPWQSSHRMELILETRDARSSLKVGGSHSHSQAPVQQWPYLCACGA